MINDSNAELFIYCYRKKGIGLGTNFILIITWFSMGAAPKQRRPRGLLLLPYEVDIPRYSRYSTCLCWKVGTTMAKLHQDLQEGYYCMCWIKNTSWRIASKMTRASRALEFFMGLCSRSNIYFTNNNMSIIGRAGELAATRSAGAARAATTTTTSWSSTTATSTIAAITSLA